MNERIKNKIDDKKMDDYFKIRELKIKLTAYDIFLIPDKSNVT